MVSFDLIPREDAGVMRMARHDLSRMKGVAKQRKAISMCNAYRVWRSDQQIRIDFLDMEQPEAKQIRMRFIYELMPPFR
jgi:hypothetical protein